MDAHAARVALLAEDLADANARHLAAAIDHHVATSPYLPKASDLRQLMADMAENRRSGELVNLADRYNQRLIAEGSALRWHYRDPNDLRSELVLASMERPSARYEDHP
jgi:hypothetical protein